jgi:hypothetical protein
MDTLDQNFHSDKSGIRVSNDAKANFITIGKWVKFLGIMGFISVGFLAILALIMIIGGSSVSLGGEQMMLIGFLYLVIAGVYIYPALYLVRTSKHLSEAFNRDSQSSFELGVENMKSFFKFVGIFTIVVISLYILMILVAVFAASASRF